MEFHRGRLIDHIEIRVADVEISKHFYRAVMASLNLPEPYEGDGYFFSDELLVTKSDDYISRVHLAFQAEDQSMVHAFYKAALGAGGRDNGAPGDRSYHPGYYAAFVLDPDGNNIEAVFNGPATRSTPSVVIKPA
ncbi:MAG: VOC family protein [Ottowia sp.]|nr:VOC family protein [Ottowia sp.]